MDYFTSRLPDYLVPFLSLSSPTDAPANPDSFPNSLFYKTDPKDFCLVITFIAVMAILRDALRLGVFEPFVKWKLSRDLRLRRKQQAVKTNGNTGVVSNGNGHSTAFTKAERRKMKHSVFRFAEQGWPIVYYPLQWGFGLVNSSYGTTLPGCINHPPSSTSTVNSQPKYSTRSMFGSTTLTSLSPHL